MDCENAPLHSLSGGEHAMYIGKSSCIYRILSCRGFDRSHAPVVCSAGFLEATSFLQSILKQCPASRPSANPSAGRAEICGPKTERS